MLVIGKQGASWNSIDSELMTILVSWNTRTKSISYIKANWDFWMEAMNLHKYACARSMADENAIDDITKALGSSLNLAWREVTWQVPRNDLGFIIFLWAKSSPFSVQCTSSVFSQNLIADTKRTKYQDLSTSKIHFPTREKLQLHFNFFLPNDNIRQDSHTLRRW